MTDATPAPSRRRLFFWSLFVAAIAALNYAARFAGSSGRHAARHISLYSYSTFAGGMVVYAVWLGVVLLICIDRFDLLALRAPRSWKRALGLALAAIAAIWAWEAIATDRKSV